MSASKASKLPFSKACEIEDFAHPDLVDVMREVLNYKADLNPAFPTGAEHRKDWEVAMTVRALRHFGALRPDATILGVAAGVEDTLFYLTRHAGRVVATDRYLAGGPWEPTAPVSMLVEPSEVAPFAFDTNRLVVQHMDGRALRYPSDSFDGVFSSSSIEHFGQLEDVANGAYEMGRVLKPGGVLTLSTEFALRAPPGGTGWPGQTLIFSVDHLRRQIIEASGLTPVDELRTEVSEATRLAYRDLTQAIFDHNARRADGGAGPHGLWDFPHIVLVHEGYVFTSVHLTLRKDDPYPAAPNDWARPTPAKIAAIVEENRTALVETAAAVEPEPPEADSAPLTSQVVRDGIDAYAYLRDLLGARSALEESGPRLAAAQAEAATRLAQLTTYTGGLRATIQQAMGAAIAHDADVHVWAGSTDSAAEEQRRRKSREMAKWEQRSVTLPSGLGFQVMIDPQAADPIATALAGGTPVDQAPLDLMLNIIQPGDRVLDLGAHVGTFSLAACAAGASVVAIEASPTNAALLRASAGINGFTALTVIHAAAGCESGPVEFIAQGPWGHLRPASGPSEEHLEVPSVSVDALLAELSGSPIRFIKMDVEGFEISALRGMVGLLTRSDVPPPALIYESNGHTLAMFGSTPSDLIGELATLGYQSYLIESGRLVGARAAQPQPQTIVDYLAAKGPLPALEGWTVEAGLEPDERIARIVADAQHFNQHHRAYIARALKEGGPEIHSNPDVAAALDRLAVDSVPAVRQAAAWWSAPDTHCGAVVP